MRTVVSYIQTYLNAMASAGATGSVEPATGLPINTGINVGAFMEVPDTDALKYSAPSGRTLYSGTYMWAQLDPAVTGTVPVGSALYWLQSATGLIVTTVLASNNPDFAGVSIDPNFGQALPYAWIQVNGKASILNSSTLAATYGAPLNLNQTTAVFDSGASITTATAANTYVGYALGAIATSTIGLARITRSVVRF